MPVVPCDKQKIRLDVTFYASFFMIIHKSVQISFITWVVCLFGVCGTNSIPFHWFITCCLFQLQWWYDLWCIQNKNRFFCIQIQTPFHLICLNPSTHKFETTMIMFIEKNKKKNNENQWVWKQTPWTTFYTHFRYVRSLSQAKAPSVTFVRSCLRADGHGHTFDVWILSQQIG